MMGEITGWYYLHENGDLIFKRTEPEVERGGFVRKIWPFDSEDRGRAHVLLVEAAAMGAREDRIDELIKKWSLTDEDCQEFASRAKLKLFKDGNAWVAAFDDFIDLQNSQCGFGFTCFQAMVELCKQGSWWEKRG